MQKIPLFLIVILCCSPVIAQKTEDAVTLKNGSIIRGKVTEQNDSIVKVSTCCGSLLVFPAGDIVQVSHEKPELSLKHPGYMNFTSFGVLIGSTDDQKTAPFSAIMEHNYRFTKYSALGAFIGFEQLNENVLPLGFNLKILFPAGRSDFYSSFSGGYSISLEKPAEAAITKGNGGMMAGFEFGLLIPVSLGSAFTFAIGYRYNELNYELEDWVRGEYKRDMTFNRFTMRFGLSIF